MVDAPVAIFFDVDGVLIDSLPQHLKICRDKARDFGLDLRIPGVEEMRERIAAGTKVSPMLFFFLAVGFPERDAERAVADYERDFMVSYRPTLFEGVPRMLEGLHRAGFELGLVTSNTRANVEPVLDGSMRYFQGKAVFFFGEYARSVTKADCLMQGARDLGVPAARCLYVGDQPADARAAEEAGFQFLGVTYGWGFMPGSHDVELVATVSGIARKLGAAGYLRPVMQRAEGT